MKPKYYAQGTMNTKDGQILGTVRYNSMWKKWQADIDGEPSGEFKTKEEAVDALKRADVKNIKINKDYVAEGKIKPTKRQIQIVEDFVKKTTKKVLNENAEKFPKLHAEAEKLADEVSNKINILGRKLKSAEMPYASQYILEELIKILEERV